jgi:flagellar basal body-associated protein FliL
MPNAPDTEPVEEKPASGGTRLWLWVVVAVLSGTAGAAVPVLLSKPASPDSTAPETVADAHALAYVPFDDVVVNLDEGHLNRYLRLVITLQIQKLDEAELQRRLDETRVILKNWLLSHISDKSLDEIRGAAGINRMRREIRDEFNAVLFPDGTDRIQDILFDEFNVQ